MENEKIDDLFDMKKMEKTIKKAKRMSSWKSVIITVIVLIILIIVSTIANRSFTYRLERPIQISASGFHEISAPNEFIGKFERYQGVLGGENRYTTYKIIEGKVVYTGDESYGYGLFRDENLNRVGTETPLLMGDSFSEKDLQKQRYNELGQREMVFFYPFIQYSNYRNDINLLDNIGQEKVMEVALSFDKGYSFNEVKKMIPEDVTLSWLWVDDVNEENVEDFHLTIRDENNKKVDTDNLVRSEHTVYGVSLFNANGDIQEEPVHHFIINIENGKHYKARWQGEYNRLFTTLGGEDEKLTEDDLQYYGVVVTGNPENLAQLKNSPFIKASSIGVITDRAIR
ncbi:MAG: anti sigma factor C-terminal domain-containing protein [Psychrobacillus sp.]